MKDQATFYKEVGRRIREIRRKHKPRLTQDELANTVGLTRTSITNVEHGRQKFLLHTLIDIADALKVEVGSLIPAASTEITRLKDELKNRPPAEKEWIMTTVKAAQTGRKDDGA